MLQTCPHCRKVLDFSGDAPRFCAYCGQPLQSDGTVVGRPGTTITFDPDATAAYTGPSPALHATAEAWTSNRTAVPTVVFPEMLAGYKLIRKLGQGGMGSVYEAEDTNSGRRVALKLMAPEYMSSGRAIERFLQEGRLASTISHPRCVFVRAADEAEGWPFIVMELMPGTTLKDLIETSGPMSSRRAIEMILDVIEGLEEAHRRGVIHRDVKPSNCFVDSDGRIKVGDFGLSKSIVDDSGLTHTGTFIGTPHFASPEQIKGEVIDERSDVYSVCATLFYLLTGRPPFEGGDAASTLAKIVSDPTPSARLHRPDLWVPLDRVIMRGLERDRRRRWGNLEELRAALSPFLPGRVTLSSIGLRIGAHVLDAMFIFLTIALGTALFEAMRWQGLRAFRDWIRLPEFQFFEEITSGLVVLAYYSLFEVLGEASPGKLLTRLRVGSAEAGPASLQSRIVRLSIFVAITVLPRRFITLGMLLNGIGQATAVRISGAIQLLSSLLLFVSARSSNGYRGLHEFGSGTAVVRLPWNFRRRRATPEAESPQMYHVSKPKEMPETVGAFRVEGAVRWSDSTRLLQAEDLGLRRAVWIVMHPLPAASVPRARTDLARLTRLRWLQSGIKDEWRWDAFVAPTGVPLIQPVSLKSTQRSWSEVREILEELATELVDASCDGTLPRELATDQVWIKPNGRVLLIDVAPHESQVSTAETDHVEAEDPQARGLDLLARVAMGLLHGGNPTREGGLRFDGTPIPRHAIPILEGLRRDSGGYESIEKFREAIHSIRDRPGELTPIQQLGHATYTFLAVFAKVWLIPAIVVAWMVIMSFMTRAQPQFTEQMWERILLFETLLWVALAMLVREGPSGLIFNVALVSTRGKPASRLRFALRELMIVGPVLLFDWFCDQLPNGNNVLQAIGAYGGFVMALTWPALIVASVLVSPGRYLIDRVARTIFVPK